MLTVGRHEVQLPLDRGIAYEATKQDAKLQSGRTTALEVAKHDAQLLSDREIALEASKLNVQFLLDRETVLEVVMHGEQLRRAARPCSRAWSTTRSSWRAAKSRSLPRR